MRELKWSDLRKKSQKNKQIIDFVIRQSKEFEFSKSNSRLMYNTIQTGLLFKKIQSSDIDFRNNRIEGIEGIEELMNSPSMLFKDVDVDESITEIEESVSNLSDDWRKFISIVIRMF